MGCAISSFRVPPEMPGQSGFSIWLAELYKYLIQWDKLRLGMIDCPVLKVLNQWPTVTINGQRPFARRTWPRQGSQRSHSECVLHVCIWYRERRTEIAEWSTDPILKVISLSEQPILVPNQRMPIRMTTQAYNFTKHWQSGRDRGAPDICPPMWAP